MHFPKVIHALTNDGFLFKIVLILLGYALKTKLD